MNIYLSKMPGQFSGNTPTKLPFPFLILMMLSRAIGVGAFAPFRAILKAAWICIRLIFDYITETDSNLDIWFLDFLLVFDVADLEYRQESAEYQCGFTPSICAPECHVRDVSL